MALFKTGFKTQRQGAATLQWGEVLGQYGVAFASTSEGPREPGPRTTEISARRVTPSGSDTEELQIMIHIHQQYRSGANSRDVGGHITLRGKALEDFLEQLKCTR